MPILPNYDNYLNRAYQKKAERDEEFDYFIELITELNLHDDPETLTYNQARKIVEEHDSGY